MMKRRGKSGPARLVCIDKPEGPSSFDVVRRVRHLTKYRKVGHGGTLDPFATGLLVLGLGAATRLLAFLAAGEKSYRATICFGTETDSSDHTGAVVRTAPVPDRDAIEAQIPRFIGSLRQVPPRQSAVKIEGRRAYALARDGSDFEMPSRDVVVSEFELLDYQAPHAEVRVRCGSGTYIRSLGRDLAAAVDSAGHLSALRRESVGSLGLDLAVPFDRAEAAFEEGHLLLDPVQLVSGWDSIVLDDERAELVRHGIQPEPSWWDGDFERAPSRLALLDARAKLVAVAEADDDSRVRLVAVFPDESST